MLLTGELGRSDQPPARALLRVAHDPAARLRDTADSPGFAERSAYGIV